jgi:hypothetical protein
VSAERIAARQHAALELRFAVRLKFVGMLWYVLPPFSVANLRIKFDLQASLVFMHRLLVVEFCKISIKVLQHITDSRKWAGAEVEVCRIIFFLLIQHFLICCKLH